MGFFRQQYWSGLSFPSPGDLPDPQGLNPHLPHLLHWQADFFFFLTTETLLSAETNLLGFIYFYLFIFLHFGHTAQHAGSLFPNQGLNLLPLAVEAQNLNCQGSPTHIFSFFFF